MVEPPLETETTMEKEFRPAPLGWLTRWMLEDLDRGLVMGIPRTSFAQPEERMVTRRFGRDLGIPLGVAAGPHTQLTQNIVAAWLCGARFIELKTVQILDSIKVSRPCIDSEDLTYNCEWSQELSLDQSFDEYLKAWVLLHALAHRLGMKSPAVLFNMSVGYNLEGIQSEKVQRFIRRMRSAPEELAQAVAEVAKVYPAVRDLAIPAEMTNHVTLSTMHGCPPAEIERIALFMLEELGLDTWVKLNPTLLGPELLRPLLNETMGHKVTVPDLAFDHDPRFDAAMAMVKNLREAASKAGRSFGLKLSNTLEVENHRPVFPPHEKMMYMSGRSLHAVTLTLAKRVTDALDGSVPISFCGGADAWNYPQLIADGLGPVTVCSDLLKPGGYARLAQYVQELSVAMDRVDAESIDELIVAMGKEAGGEGVAGRARRNLAKHVEQVTSDPRFARNPKRVQAKSARELGFFDCAMAPCQEACPSHQNIPDYLHLVAAGRADEALQTILCTNPLPAITGRVCDHPCTEHCIRNHYDEPLAIREIKRFAAASSRFAATKNPDVAGARRTAVIGAGPAGLSAAYYLRMAGLPVTVFDQRKDPGGMASRVIPEYRLVSQAIEDDVERVRRLGAELRFETAAKARDLHDQGYDYVVLAAGAQTGKKLDIPGDKAAGVMDALEFLDRVRRHDEVKIGPRVLVIGGGNSAMDAARTARRLVPPGGSVTVVYRRVREHMPAEVEEIDECLHEGVQLRELLAPLEVEVSGGKAMALKCGKMRLGDADASGRPRPVAIEGAFESIPCETILVAISQDASREALEGLEVAGKRDGTVRVDEAGRTSIPWLFAAGDVSRGPATVIKAIADGRFAAGAIATEQGVQVPGERDLAKGASIADMLHKKARKTRPRSLPMLGADHRGGFDEVIPTLTADMAAQEASRCLDCDELCSLCVTVCPNRANQMYATPKMTVEAPVVVAKHGKLEVESRAALQITQAVQIVNVADFCNECGNCTTFCPTAGAPWRDKPRMHFDREGFEKAHYDAVLIERSGKDVRLEAKVGGEKLVVTRTNGVVEGRTGRATARWDAGTGKLLEVRPEGAIADGERLDLRVIARFVPVLEASSVLPTD